MEMLTNKELTVLNFITKGYDNKEISLQMFISIHTVKAHISSIIKKLNAKNRTNAVFIACKSNLV